MSKQMSRSFILVPIDFSYATSYRLSIVAFALRRAVQSQYNNVTEDDGRRQTDGRNTVA